MLFYFLRLPRPPEAALTDSLFPYTALFRSNSAIRDIHVLGRRGPHQIAMTPKELGELGHLEAAAPHVDIADFPPEGDDALLEPGMRKSVTYLRSEEHTSELQSLMRISYAVFCLKKKTKHTHSQENSQE